MEICVITSSYLAYVLFSIWFWCISSEAKEELYDLTPDAIYETVGEDVSDSGDWIFSFAA